MNKIKQALVIDAGNTRTKVAIFENETIKSVLAFENEDFIELKKHLLENAAIPTILSSVRSEENTSAILALCPNAVLFSHEMKLPIQLRYQTPETLGKDRLANALATCMYAKGNSLVVDIGTCIKFDFVDNYSMYHGGSISPGLQMRYKALHQFTGKLPLLSKASNPILIGVNTESSIHSGVINGIQAELNQFITDYLQKYNDLTVFITGGDASSFDFDRKNRIFALPNLTLDGLFFALKYTHDQ